MVTDVEMFLSAVFFQNLIEKTNGCASFVLKYYIEELMELMELKNIVESSLSNI